LAWINGSKITMKNIDGPDSFVHLPLGIIFVHKIPSPSIVFGSFVRTEFSRRAIFTRRQSGRSPDIVVLSFHTGHTTFDGATSCIRSKTSKQTSLTIKGIIHCANVFGHPMFVAKPTNGTISAITTGGVCIGVGIRTIWTFRARLKRWSTGYCLESSFGAPLALGLQGLTLLVQIISFRAMHTNIGCDSAFDIGIPSSKTHDTIFCTRDIGKSTRHTTIAINCLGVLLVPTERAQFT
jgi:hypothetical protein